MSTLRRLTIITFLCLLPNAFGQRADALTFVYGGREGRLISNDNSTTIQTWNLSTPYSAHMSDSGTIWYTSGGGFGGWGGRLWRRWWRLFRFWSEL